MSNVKKLFLSVSFVVLAGFGLFTINVLFTVPTVMAMPWNGKIFDAVCRTSERGLLKEVTSRRGVRNSGRESRGGASRGSEQSRGGGATTGRGSTRERAGTPGRTKPGGSGVTRGNRGKASARGRGHRADRRYSARKDARRDYRRFRAITGAIRLGVYLATRPRYSTTVVVTGWGASGFGETSGPRTPPPLPLKRTPSLSYFGHVSPAPGPLAPLSAPRAPVALVHLASPGPVKGPPPPWPA